MARACAQSSLSSCRNYPFATAAERWPSFAPASWIHSLRYTTTDPLSSPTGNWRKGNRKSIDANLTTRWHRRCFVSWETDCFLSLLFSLAVVAGPGIDTGHSSRKATGKPTRRKVALHVKLTGVSAHFHFVRGRKTTRLQCEINQVAEKEATVATSFSSRVQ